MSARAVCPCGWEAKTATVSEAEDLAGGHYCPPPPLPDLRTADATLISALLSGTRWTTACDLAGLPDQGRATATRLGLLVEPVNGAVRNLPVVVGRLLRAVALNLEATRA